MVAVSKVKNGMSLMNCSERRDCDNHLNRSEYGCIDSGAGYGAMAFSDVAPPAADC